MTPLQLLAAIALVALLGAGLFAWVAKRMGMDP